MDTLILCLLLTAAAGTANGVYLAPDSSTAEWEIESFTVCPNATSAADGTNYASVRGYKGASTAVTAARTTASTAYTAGTAEAAAITATGADKVITQANPLSFRATHSGSGVAVNLSITVRVRVRRS